MSVWWFDASHMFVERRLELVFVSHHMHFPTLRPLVGMPLDLRRREPASRGLELDLHRTTCHTLQHHDDVRCARHAPLQPSQPISDDSALKLLSAVSPERVHPRVALHQDLDARPVELRLFARRLLPGRCPRRGWLRRRGRSPPPPSHHRFWLSAEGCLEEGSAQNKYAQMSKFCDPMNNFA